MRDIGILPANLAGIVLESCFYGTFLLLFFSNVYFLATRGDSQTTRHSFTSLMFLGAAGLSLVITVVSSCCSQFTFALLTARKHWVIVIYQAFFAFTYLDNKAAETTFYLDATHWTEIVKQALLLTSILMGDLFVVSPTKDHVKYLLKCSDLSLVDILGKESLHRDTPDRQLDCSIW
jgi:hypothetical protein